MIQFKTRIAISIMITECMRNALSVCSLVDGIVDWIFFPWVSWIVCIFNNFDVIWLLIPIEMWGLLQQCTWIAALCVKFVKQCASFRFMWQLDLANLNIMSKRAWKSSYCQTERCDQLFTFDKSVNCLKSVAN